VYCVWQVVETQTNISKNPVCVYIYIYLYIFFFKTWKLQIFSYLKNLISAACIFLGPLPDSVQSSMCNKKVTVITFNSVSCCYSKAPFTYGGGHIRLYGFSDTPLTVVLKIPFYTAAHFAIIANSLLRTLLVLYLAHDVSHSHHCQELHSGCVLSKYCSSISASFQQILQLRKNIYC
jgi:hypothetical protein